MNRLSGTVNTKLTTTSMITKMSGYDDLMILTNKVDSLSLEMKLSIFKLLVHPGGNERKHHQPVIFARVE